MARRALSLKQPWAALLAAGLKTIEVRRWRTDHKGELLIHAARVPDERPEAWALVPEHLRDLARLERGIIGVGTLTKCIHYPTAEAFQADQGLHLNDPSWFEPAGLFGFRFGDLRVLPFRPMPGFVRIFEVDFVEDGETARQGDKETEAGAASLSLSSPPGRFGRLMRSLGGKDPKSSGRAKPG